MRHRLKIYDLLFREVGNNFFIKLFWFSKIYAWKIKAAMKMWERGIKN